MFRFLPTEPSGLPEPLIPLWASHRSLVAAAYFSRLFMKTNWYISLRHVLLLSGLTAAGVARAQTEGAIVTRHGAMVRGALQGSLVVLDETADVVIDHGAVIVGAITLPADKTKAAKPTRGDPNPPKLSPIATINVAEPAAIKGAQRVARGFALPKLEKAKKPAGTQSVVLQNGREPEPDFTKVKNVILRNVPDGVLLPARSLAMPPGAYGDITIESGRLLLGVPGSRDRTRYSLGHLTVGPEGGIELLGPVVLTVEQLGPIGGVLGNARFTQWLDLRVTAGEIVFGPGSEVHGVLTAPESTVAVGRGAKIRGGVICDKATLDNDARFTGVQPSWSAEATGNAAPMFIHKAARVQQRMDEMEQNWGDAFTFTIGYPDDVPNLEVGGSGKVDEAAQRQVFFDACCSLLDATGFATGHLTVKHGGAASLAIDVSVGKFEEALRTIGGREPIRDGIRIIRNDPIRLAAFMERMSAASSHP
jgi:hypothetical protein